MNARQLRGLIAALSSGLLAWLLLRRRTALLQQLPDFVEEYIVLPMGDLVRDGRGNRLEMNDGTQGRLTRKVGRNRRISVGGKLYGPLEQEFVGQQVEVEERDDRIVVFAGNNEVGSFERQDV
jgi:hypothetical protein